MTKNLLIGVAALTVSTGALAFGNCTKEPKDKWQDQAAFQQKLKDQGYQIKKFKVSGTCYEIYGKDKEGKRVEIYFDPTNGDIKKKGD